MLVSVLGESAYTVFFDMANKVPVSLNGYSQSEISIDAPQGAQTITTNNEVETSCASMSDCPMSSERVNSTSSR